MEELEEKLEELNEDLIEEIEERMEEKAEQFEDYESLSAEQKAQAHEDQVIRNSIEGKFGQGKRKFSLGRIMAKLKNTSETAIGIIFLVAPGH